MNNSARVIKELQAVLNGLANRYRPDDVVAIGLRYSDKLIDKIECFYKEIVGRLFYVIDGKDPVCDEHKESVLQSIFIIDSSGSTLYDSKDYTPSKDKMSLKKDGDRRLMAFRGLTQEQKDQVVDLTEQQIYAFIDHIGPNDDISKTNAPDSTWGEMPWDPQK